ncbi:MAG: hypothetical protein U0R26_09260 [Solirubrobacterales bacterium]
MLAVAAIVVAAIVLGSGGGDGGEPGTAAGQTTSSKDHRESSGQAKQAQTKPGPKPLTRPKLIERGDAICTESQESFKTYSERFPTGEEEPDAIYSRLLVGISSKAVRQFNELEPPAPLRKPYAKYVASQEEVAQWDRDALRAAENGDATAYLTAREDRNATQEARRQLAEAVGFRVCSGSEL